MELTELNLTEEQMEVVNKAIQSNTDKVRTDYSLKLKGVEGELAKYKPTEKSDSEKALEERLAILEAKEKEISNKEKAMTIADKLSAKGLPSELANYLNINGDDLDKTIDEVGATVNNYFLNSGNKPNNHTTNKGLTKKDFKAMSYGERAKLFQENAELYKALSN